jgi:hypothetical protein
MSDEQKFFVLQTIKEGQIARRTTKSGAVRIGIGNILSTANLSERQYLTSLKMLEAEGIILMEDWPGRDDSGAQRHFQVMPTHAFEPLYKKLQRKFPEANLHGSLEPVLKYGGVIFRPPTGEFSYKATKGTMRPGSAPWSALLLFMRSDRNIVLRTEIVAAVRAARAKYKTKSFSKSASSIDPQKIIRDLRRKLRMGKTSGSTNPDLFNGSGDGRGYRMMPK